jgi:hypothetical protein
MVTRQRTAEEEGLAQQEKWDSMNEEMGKGAGIRKEESR